MSNILTASVSIKGVRPILWHHFGPESLPLEKKEKVGVAGNSPAEWQVTVLCTKEGQLYIEPSYVFGCLREGAKYTKKGKASLQRPVSATMQVVDNRILIDRYIPGFNGKLPDSIPTDPELPVYLDIRGVVNPSTRGRNIRYRVAASPGWLTEFNLMWDKTIVSRGEMEAVIIDSGRLVGLGNGRSIGYGRFELLKFEIIGE